jgi:hypothetical protein
MIHPSVDAVISYWVAHKVNFLPGVSEDEILAFEEKYSVRVPDDMRCFYRTTNGTRVPLYSGQDHESYDFWPLSLVQPDSDYRWAMSFVDYRERSWWYAIDLTGEGGFGSGTVYFMGAEDGRPLIVARSFSDFLDLYVRSDEPLWPSGAAALHKSFVSDDVDSDGKAN